MSESEIAVQGRAASGDDAAHRVCAQLVASRPRYSTWVASHDRPMWTVAGARQREAQTCKLRLVATHQIHRAALVRHLRDNEVVGASRAQLFAEFYGPLDSDCAVLAEHRNYQQAVSSQLCATDLLQLVGDRHGLELLEAYQQQYGLYFAMYCDRLLARLNHRPYILSSLVPEVRATAGNLRQMLVAGHSLPSRRLPAR